LAQLGQRVEAAAQPAQPFRQCTIISSVHDIGCRHRFTLNANQCEVVHVAAINEWLGCLVHSPSPGPP